MKHPILQSWRKLNAGLYQRDEQQVGELLQYERENERRLSVLQRLHQRYNTLRVTRERLEILGEAKAK